MFCDGLFYAAVSNNYAHHIGTFWDLKFTAPYHPDFTDQPPLAIFMQAQFFKVLGDSIFVERFYCFLFALLNIYMIKKIWVLVADKDRDLFWLPVLVWIIFPLTPWAFQNNLIEVTMSAFDLLAVYFIIKGCRKNSYILLILGGLFTICAGFSKGFQGLFPLIAPVLYWIVYRHVNFTKGVVQFISVLIFPVVTILVLYSYPLSHDSLQHYLDHRISGTFNHLQDTTTSHFSILGKLLFHLVIPAVPLLILWLFMRRRAYDKTTDTKALFFFILVAMSASVPLMITLEQREFYLTTSLPYYALVISLLSLPFVRQSMVLIPDSGRIRNLVNTVLIMSGILLVALVAINSSRIKREKELVADLYIFKEILPETSTVSISPELNDWNYYAYFTRYCRVNLDDKSKQRYYVSEIGAQLPSDTCYRKMDLPLKKFT